MLYGLLKILLSPFVRLFWVKSVTGLDNLPRTGPFILASNHESNLDPLVVSCVIPRRLYYLTGEKFYRYAFFRFLMNATQQIYVDRRAKDKSSVYAETKGHLAKGRVVAIFPEGTRSRTGQMGKAFLGVGRLALLNKVDIVPVVIRGTFGLYPSGKRLPKIGKKVEVSILPVIRYKDIQNLTEEIITHKIVMKQIAIAKSEEYTHA